MFESDYMLNEARKFAELLARLMGLKADGKYEEYNDQFNEILQKEYDTEVEKLLALSEEDFIAALKLADYSTEKLNALSQLLYVFAQPFNADEETILILKKVLCIFDLLENEHHYQSFENIDKRKTIYHYFNTYA
ncbi:hypothetical protein HDF18_18385 [Mucilaginibacter sp. X5P1]|uniref:hypothetical protein n=1 Tax=Mucilaginibacter sp. X5P1 TaxID=2723088 RepID=UPI00160DEEE2|nr:hypothetical protein [Mucilaginibacter sp. X5P1]MBB6139610.1 hypothetical protein [Mucilaginibacter sp. X5P1]